MNKINNRYEFTMIFDVENRDFKSDIYSENDILIDWETGHSVVTDLYLKRKIRHFVNRTCEGKEQHKILFQSDKPLGQKYEEAYKVCDLTTGKKGKDASAVSVVKDYMCRTYYDVRTFGAVMDDSKNPCGSVHGPVQISFARSFDPVCSQEQAIPKQLMTKENGDKNDMNYALYRVDGFISASCAEKTGFSEEDLEILWNAIVHMFDSVRKAKGKFRMRKLIVFKHENPLGNAPSVRILENVLIKKKEDVDIPCKFSDYTITIKEMPEGIEVIEKL
jgi:CRISPR-associated protein Csd2